MNLEIFGFNSYFDAARQKNGWQFSEIGRVMSESREIYSVQTEEGILQSEITGKIRYSADSRLDLPAIGDWVLVSKLSDGEGVIRDIFPRKTIFGRRAIGASGNTSHFDQQIIATNIDTAFIVMAADRDFNLNRLERYLVLVLEQSINAVVILNKIDLMEAAEVDLLCEQIKSRHDSVSIFCCSAVDESGLDQLEDVINPGQTFCFVGSSGVGKSTLINYFAGKSVQKTQGVGLGTSRGKHTTTKREMVLLDNGSIMIDTPGMRQIGMIDAENGISNVYSDIELLISSCKFTDCLHANEPGCAIRAALESGELDPKKWKNYRKIQKEASHYKRISAQKQLKHKQVGRKSSKMLKQNYA